MTMITFALITLTTPSLHNKDNLTSRTRDVGVQTKEISRR